MYIFYIWNNKIIIHNNDKANKATTLSGYGITNGVTTSDSRLTDSRPASDVYSWAKSSSKPSYSWSEITSKPSTFTPSSHTHPQYLDKVGSEQSSGGSILSYIIASGSAFGSYGVSGATDAPSGVAEAAVTWFGSVARISVIVQNFTNPTKLYIRHIFGNNWFNSDWSEIYVPSVPTVPTNVSAFNNDSNYLSRNSLSLNTFTDNYNADWVKAVANSVVKLSDNLKIANIAFTSAKNLADSGSAWVACGQVGYGTNNDGWQFEIIGNKGTILTCKISGAGVAYQYKASLGTGGANEWFNSVIIYP